MKGKSTISLSLGTALAVLSVFIPAAPPAFAQRRIVEDTSNVKVTRRSTTRTITRGPSRVAAARTASNGMLVVLTDPPSATVKIDGRAVGTSDDNGEFMREMRAGSYKVEVDGGDEYAPFAQTVRLAARGTEIVRAPLVNVNASKFGLVKIGPAIDGARVFVDDGKQPWAKVTVDREQNVMLVDGLTPGKHKLRVDHPDYVIVEKTFPNVSAGDEYFWVFKPEFATVPLRVATEPGTTVFIDNEPRGDTPESGVLEINDVRIGEHEIKLVKDGYVEHKVSRAFDYGTPVEMAHKMVPLPTSAEFADDFDVNLNKWMMPGGAAVKTGRLTLQNANKLIIAKNTTFRDFVMAFHLRLEDDKGAAWAVRAKDPDNYYLFYVSGPKGLFPGRFTTYVVKDGRFDPQQPVQSVPVITDFRAGGEYQVEIRGSKDTIEHIITPSSTGRAEPLGVFQDPEKTFLYGGLGFRTVANEQYSIDDLFVQPRGQ